MSFDRKSLELLSEALEHLDNGFDTLSAFEAEADLDALRPVLLAAAERMRSAAESGDARSRELSRLHEQLARSSVRGVAAPSAYA